MLFQRTSANNTGTLFIICRNILGLKQYMPHWPPGQNNYQLQLSLMFMNQYKTQIWQEQQITFGALLDTVSVIIKAFRETVRDF